MIEVEKKFLLTPSQITELTKNTTFIKEIVFKDTYYDKQNFQNILNDIWLRNREGKFQLKVPLSVDGNKLVDQYKELEHESEIISFLEMDQDKNLFQNIETHNYQPFCICSTTRKKYKKDEFIIDIDEVEYEDFIYSICEIELMVESESEVEEAIQKILDFSKTYGLKFAPVRGKVVEYLRKKHPEVYKAL